MDEISFSNLNYVEEQYQRYLVNPTSLEPSWRHFFEGWDLARKVAPVTEARETGEAREPTQKILPSGLCQSPG
ncbi:MAG TPA: hypothetical protein VFU89_06335, partial [Rhabdochlamydiaceae bacterium]|nr:hypothetical protein [Rhabdochlamydiaceae bacterium]